MCDDGAAEVRALAGAEIDDAIRQADLFEQLHELGGDGGRVDGRLQDHGVSGDDGRRGHSGHDGEGEVPGRNHRADAERNVAELVALAGELDGRLRLIEAERFARRRTRGSRWSRLRRRRPRPSSCRPRGEPRAELEAAFANELGGAEEQGGALGDRESCSRSEGGLRGLHRRFDVLGACALVDADDLRRDAPDSIERILPVGLDALAADDRCRTRGRVCSRTSASASSMRRLFSGWVKSTNGSLAKGVSGAEARDGVGKIYSSHNVSILARVGGPSSLWMIG